MNKLSPRLLCEIYVLLVLLVVVSFSALPYSLAALALLLVMLFITLRPLGLRFNLVITLTAVFLLPLVLEPLLNYLSYATRFSQKAGQTIAALSALPIIYLLDYQLKQNGHNVTLGRSEGAKGQKLTTVSRSLLMALLLMLVVSLIVNSLTLMLTSIIFALYWLVILVQVLLAIPQPPLDLPTMRRRIIAGTAVDISLEIMSRASVELHSLLSPVESWVKIKPERFTLGKGKVELNLTATPPLAGPSHPQLQLSATDSRGFLQINQRLEPVALEVIPRAKYAEWLATRYLEQAKVGAGAITPLKVLMPKRGIEYFGSRVYQPGDQLKDIDWKHTLKLSQLITKEYIEAAEPAAIIAVNLAVTNAEVADKLAFNLITTALTFARETIPTALAAYNHQRVIITTPVTDPREILKQTLSLIKDISQVEFTQRFLGLPDIKRLRRDISQLKQVTSEPAQRLLGLLNFEYQVIEKAAKNEPATVALSLVTEHAPARAVIVLISEMNHDAEALLIGAEKLSRRDFTVVPIKTK